MALAAIVALGVSLFNTCQAHQANEIARRSVEPKIVVVQARMTSFAAQPDGTVSCRTYIVLFNSGQSTSLLAVRSLLSFGDYVVPLTNDGPPNRLFANSSSGFDAVVNVWTSPPPAKEIYGTKSLYEAALLATGESLPARVEAHTTTELYVDVTAKPADGRPPKTVASFFLIFPDNNVVETGRVDLCQ